MSDNRILEIISKILNKNINEKKNITLSEIENIDSLDYVKVILGLKKYKIKLKISDFKKLKISEISNLISDE